MDPADAAAGPADASSASKIHLSEDGEQDPVELSSTPAEDDAGAAEDGARSGEAV